MKCDFCSSENNLNWRYPTEGFTAFISEEITGFSTEDWIACDYCHHLIEAKDWYQLAENSARTHPLVIAGFVKADQALDEILKLHRRFRQSRLGSPARIT